MPFYEFDCEQGHRVTALMAITDETETVTCPTCNAPARRVISLSSFVGFEGATARTDAAIYSQHNVTREETVPYGAGTITRKPISVSQGCQCGNCASHTRRNAITGTAEPGKVR